ncbi:MAG: U32 family peptidase [Verrucomicrobia bacterium]|nr:U32 family peptidase [Verrucomicrobiota bacterium]
MPELLAPAGDWACVRAAVENGADAIYFGLDRFNARMRADNFSEAELPRLMEFLHRRGVRGYLTFNTLVFTEELPEAERFLRAIIAAGVDAAIVQDIGICRLIRRLSPDFPIHASTQMTITSAAGVELARELGCALVVLARECSLRDIAAIQQSTGAALPLEVFVHGALCVAYSGQCLTSESLGGRSANRGECAQACRLPYELVSDGQTVPLGDRRYLLSPQDLASVELIPELVRLGLASLKIEGRLKSPEYVASITRIYRQALDRCRPQANGAGGPAQASLNPPADAPGKTRYEMQMAFSRGLYTGWFGGVNNQELVHTRYPKKRGVYLGEVLQVLRDGVRVRLSGPLKPGDGVVFDAGRPDEPEEGGRVYEIRGPKAAVRGSNPAAAEREAVLTFGNGEVDFRRIRPGDRLWKTSDPALERELRQTFEGDEVRFQRPLEFEVFGEAGLPMTVVARDEAGHVARVSSTMPLEVATQQPLTAVRLAQQLGRLGGTPFRLGRLENRLEGEVHLPVSELNRIRREVVADIERQRIQPSRWVLREATGDDVPERSARSAGERAELAPDLVVLVRSLPQLEAALATGVATVYCELEDPKRYRDAVALARARPDRPELFVAPPRITKPGEEWILRQVRASEADGYLVRNYDHLRFFGDCRCVGDYSLNIANPLAAGYFIERFRLERVTASYDLNNAQLEALLAAAPPEWFEITIHQHMPMFHMEHCVFCAFLSRGKDYRDCGRPCEKHAVQLRDRVGALHPLKADAGCRNTVYNARAQTGAEYVHRFIALGARRFRLEFLDESPAEVTRTIQRYRELLAGQITGAQLWRELKLQHQLGVTRGTLDRGERPVTVL